MENSSIACGTIGGTFLSLLLNIKAEDIINTILLAIVGAIVSFLISVLLRCILKKHFKK